MRRLFSATDRESGEPYSLRCSPSQLCGTKRTARFNPFLYLQVSEVLHITF